jgi:hypothetical protein
MAAQQREDAQLHPANLSKIVIRPDIYRYLPVMESGLISMSGR